MSINHIIIKIVSKFHLFDNLFSLPCNIILILYYLCCVLKPKKPMIKIQIKSIYGSILFEHSSENNTIKETLERAIKENADLYNADLRSADLRSADLRSADLRSADLYNANLRSANLENANLRSANLYSALNKELAYLPIFCKWSHCIIGDKIKIGCKERTIEDWDAFFASDETFSTQRGTDDFKQIQAVYESYKAYLSFLLK